MIELTVGGTNSRKVFIAHTAIAEVREAGASSRWHGIKAHVRTFDGRTLEVQESVFDIVKKIEGAGHETT